MGLFEENGTDVRDFMLINENSLDFSIVLVSTKVLIFRVEEVFQQLKSFNLDRVNLFDDIPVHELGARWLRDASFVNPSLSVFDRVESLSNLEEWGNFVLSFLEFKLSEEILESFVLACVNVVEFFNTKHDRSGTMLNFVFFQFFAYSSYASWQILFFVSGGNYYG